MRRIAAVFASKRSDRSDAASSTAASSAPDNHSAPHAHKKEPAKPHTRFFRSISRKSKPVDPVVNRLNSSELHPPSSSSSSSGAPTTPDDDRGSLLRAPVSKAWHTLPHPAEPHSPSAFLHPEPPPPDRLPFHSPFRSRAAAPSRQSTLDTEDDSSEESSVAAHDLSRPLERSTPLAAPAYLLALTSNNLRPPFAPPPLLHEPGCPLFPRSCNPRRTLPYADSMESTMHRKRLERHLQRGDLSPSERRSIASFAGRRTALKERLSLQLDDNAVEYKHIRPYSSGLKRWADRPCFEDRVQVLLAENLPLGSTDEPRWTRVAPAQESFGVAALEYSVALELLAGLYEDDLPGDHTQPEPELERESRAPEPSSAPLDFLRLDTTHLAFDLSPPLSPSPVTLSPSSPSESSLSPAPSLSATPPVSAPAMVQSISSSSTAHASARNQQYKATPSPLRMEATAQAVASPATSSTTTVVSSPQPAPSIGSPPASAPPLPLKSALKQGVRFAEGEKTDRDDSVPFGYVQRIKQKREEKARFLQAERERRKHEEERRRHEEEKRKWEEERATWEREKRAIEEERKKRLYAEELAAARSRRESQRFGSLGSVTGGGLATGQWDRPERRQPERESPSTYARPVYDPVAAHPHAPARQGSDSSIARQSRVGSASGSGSSPSGSRPSSVYGTANMQGSSRPSSVYGTPSSSQQDVRLRERERERERERRVSGTGSRRGSMISEGGGSYRHPEPVPMPPMPQMWGMNMGMGMNMNVPPMVPMPMPMYGVGMDMPLLPPSPPFMMQQYGYRPPSQNSNRNSQHSQHSPSRSHSSSPTLGRHNLPASGSNERVNRLSQSHGSSSSARAPSVPRSESTPQQRRGHHRTSSGDITTHRPSAGHRAQSDDRRSTISTPQRPVPTHSSSMPTHPPPSFTQPRQSWALPQSGFENLSRPSQGGRRQTVIS
ncbi:hypothetical protein C8Q70DRAFT_1052829 [Cubamyces menziesii]|uniref:Uncharacterized protein n=1 Tax=Trametes cubensis TaxID=1111947 RepID=A0AAD7TTR3_9APHY|nr:hypothetical protein C8Q70DRAFT_1052829 [Cubamyces menziesii]KAJ8481777.1 hypothetical protein ONZ51_g5782 [Trametes cubensis]